MYNSLIDCSKFLCRFLLLSFPLHLCVLRLNLFNHLTELSVKREESNQHNPDKHCIAVITSVGTAMTPVSVGGSQHNLRLLCHDSLQIQHERSFRPRFQLDHSFHLRVRDERSLAHLSVGCSSRNCCPTTSGFDLDNNHHHYFWQESQNTEIKQVIKLR